MNTPDGLSARMDSVPKETALAEVIKDNGYYKTVEWLSSDEMVTLANKTLAQLKDWGFFADTDPERKELKEALSGTMVSKAAFVLLAAKVNYRSTNHHVGQGTWAGYGSKVADLILNDGQGKLDQTSEYYNLVWTLSHAVDTRAAIAELEISCGFPEAGHDDNMPRHGMQVIAGHGLYLLYSTPDYRAIFTPTEDLKLRIKSLPAGARDIENEVNVLKKSATSPYGIVASTETVEEAVKVWKWFQDAKWKTLHYHVGSNFLLSKVVSTVADKPMTGEDYKSYIAGICKLVMTSKSFKDQRAIKYLEDYDNSMVFATIKALKKAFAKTLEVEDIVKAWPGGMALAPDWSKAIGFGMNEDQFKEYCTNLEHIKAKRAAKEAADALLTPVVPDEGEKAT